ncbi:hypothetical protein PTKU15_85090 [Paraburkholderia terrae]|nr:hypothetical protein PTKU15_85090 [Paraburkholderia terrae]
MAADGAPRQNALAGDAAEKEPARILGATAKPAKECRSAISSLMWVARTQSGKQSMTKPRDEKAYTTASTGHHLIVTLSQVSDLHTQHIPFRGIELW